MSCRHKWAPLEDGWKRCIRCLETGTTEQDEQKALEAHWNRVAGATVEKRQVFLSKRRQWSKQQTRRKRGRSGTAPPVEVRAMTDEDRSSWRQQ